MTSTRRIGAEDSATRTALLDAALALILEEGYASVTSRRVAAKAGLKPQLVHYYFRTMDDLFVALVRRGAEENLKRQARVLESPTPLRTLWEFSSDPAGAILTIEFSALANHRKAIRAELASYAEHYRRVQTELLTQVLDRYGIDIGAIPPAVAPVVLTAVTQILVLEQTMGVTTGHDELRDVVERWLDSYEPTVPTTGRQA